ncbi:FadR/GntR family transcriptional regulator [Paenibacillus tarimensis]
MVSIQPVKKITVTEQVMEQIASLIRSGELAPGQQLPNERDLAKQFGVTRGRVREALRALSLVGLITIKAGEGSFVKPQEEPIPSDTIVWMFHNELNNLDDVYAARKLIESEVYLTAVRHAASGDIVRLENIAGKLQEVKTEPQRFLDLLDQFDLWTGDICGNRIYAKLMQTIVYLRRETSLKLLSVPGAIENSIQSRTELLEALKSKNIEQMEKAVADFFGRSKTFYKKIGGNALY